MLSQAMSFSLMRALLRRGRAFVTPKIRSRNLRRGLRTFISAGGRTGYLNVPHYWARYAHDGHNGFSVRHKKMLVWFKNPDLDPRNQGGRALTLREARNRRLTPAQFYYAKKRNMIYMSKSVGPTRTPNPFFTQGMAGFPREADKVIKKELPKLLAAELKKRGLLNVTIRDHL